MRQAKATDPKVKDVIEHLERSTSYSTVIKGTNGKTETNACDRLVDEDTLRGYKAAGQCPDWGSGKQTSAFVSWNPNHGSEDCGVKWDQCESLVHELKHAYNLQTLNETAKLQYCGAIKDRFGCKESTKKEKWSECEEKDAVQFQNLYRGTKPPRCCYAECPLGLSCCLASPLSNKLQSTGYIGGIGGQASRVGETQVSVESLTTGSCPVCPAERQATNGKCAPAVIFRVATELYSNPWHIDKFAIFLDGSFEWADSIITPTGSGVGYATITAADGHLSGDFDVRYAGADGTINITDKASVTTYFAGPVGRPFTFRLTNSWTISDANGTTGSFGVWNGSRVSNSSTYQASRSAAVGRNARFAEYPGVCYGFYSEFPGSVTGGMDRLGHPQYVDVKVRAHFDISVDFQ